MDFSSLICKSTRKEKTDIFTFKSKVDIFVEIFVCIAKDKMVKNIEQRTKKKASRKKRKSNQD